MEFACRRVRYGREGRNCSIADFVHPKGTSAPDPMWVDMRLEIEHPGLADWVAIESEFYGCVNKVSGIDSPMA
jgi:hypothetical protein